MRVIPSTTDIPTAGTRVQLSNTADRVKSIDVRARPGNIGNSFFGTVTVSATVGWTLMPGESKPLNFGEGSVLLSVFYVDTATNGNDVDWIAIVE